MYSLLVEGLLQAGVEERHLKFFRIHIGCDDEHAETLEKMMCSYFHEPDWFNTCKRAMDHALTLRQRFFENLLEALPHQRVKRLIASVQNEAAPGPAQPGECLHRAGAEARRSTTTPIPARRSSFASNVCPSTRKCSTRAWCGFPPASATSSTSTATRRSSTS
jgi:hypothetical protein